MSDSVIDSVMGHMRALLQELTDAADNAERRWLELSKEIHNSGWSMFEPTQEEERATQLKQETCNEFYDKAKVLRESRNMVARHVRAIIDENIEIQFSKWNMQ